jgi:glycosyltransferase involved in cell wall biosynthesis
MAYSFAYLFERFPSFVQTFVYREALEMVRQEMEPWLVSIRRPEDPADLAVPLEEGVFYLPEPDVVRGEVDRLHASGELPWRVRRAITRARKEKDSNRFFEAAWLGPQLKSRGIRHIHAHFGAMAARTAWWLKTLYGIRYSFTGHANDIFCETDFPVSNTDLVRAATFVITETDYAKAWMENRHPAARGKIFRVYNGIDSDFPPRKPPTSRQRILSVGRYVEKKGFKDLISACGILRQRAPGRDFECSIAGGGPLEAELQSQIDRAGLNGTVSLLGPRSQAEVRELLSSAQVFVLPCVPEAGGGSDNLPTVLMEAMMAGVPAVSTTIAGVPEMIRPGQNGLLVEPRSPDSLATAIEYLLDQPSQAERYAGSARRTAQEVFSTENTTRSLKHLLVKHAGVRPPAGARRADPAIRLPWYTRLLGR